MKIYNISKGQLITIWIFGVLLLVFGSFYWLVQSGELGRFPFFSSVLLLFIPFALIFYTLGWRKHNSQNKL